ncbi:MAG: universal stress protein [Cyanobacteria bacterium SBLK]|nr:universal stress protein [Cyanobacteria bacterium SBLK]
MTVRELKQETLENAIADFQIDDKGFQKILVAIDRESTPPEVLEKAVSLAGQFNGHLMLFHCLHDLLPNNSNVLAAGSMGIYGGSYSAEMLEQSQKLARQEKDRVLTWLQSWCQKLTDMGIATEFDYKQGDAGQTICTLAESWGADTIVIGRRGRSGLSEMLLGSVSNYVLHHAPCAVMVVQ